MAPRLSALFSLRPAPLGLALSACLLLGALPAWSQGAATTTPASAPANSSKRAPAKPLWSALSTAQQTALGPLANHWDRLSAPHKRKWLALSRNFAQFTPDEQTVLHSRMTEWAALSPQQRAVARLNFAEVNRLPAAERKAGWEAYQQLPDEEKRKLSEGAPPRARSAAVPARAGAMQNQAPAPQPLPGAARPPRIQLTPPAAAKPARAKTATPAADTPAPASATDTTPRASGRNAEQPAPAP